MNKVLKLAFILALCQIDFSMSAQKYMTKTGSVSFNANSPLEKIEASTNSAACLLDAGSGKLDFVVQIKSFVFEKQLMQEHFNENYLESDQFPKSTFKGSIVNKSAIDFNTREGVFPVEVKGKLTIHGVTRDVLVKGQIQFRKGKPELTARFNVLMSDYNIEIPGAVKDKIAREAKIDVKCALEPMP